MFNNKLSKNKKTKTEPNLILCQDEEAEKSVLGSFLLDKEAITKIVDFLTPEDFYKKAHQEIYSVIQELYKNNEPIDILSVSSKIKEKKLTKKIGGISYLTSLANSVPSPIHVFHYANIVRKKRVLRDLINASHEIAYLAYENKEDVDIILDEAERKIFSIAQSSLKQDFTPIKTMLKEAFDRIERVHQNNFRGIPTGFYDLDNYLSGLQRSDLIVLAARPGLGKSALSLDIARHTAVDNKLPVLIFNLEMSQDQIIDRLIAAQANISLWKLRTGKLSSDNENENKENDFSKINEAIATLAEAPIYISDTPIINVLQIKAMARRLQAKKELGLIVIDYLQLMQSRNSNYNSRVQEISEISRSLKSLARELNVPVLALSQLSRAVEQRTPQIPKLPDLRESGSIEQDADVVLFIYREDRDKKDTDRKNIADIIIAKHRNGPIGKINLYFDNNSVSFKNLEKNIAQSLEESLEFDEPDSFF